MIYEAMTNVHAKLYLIHRIDPNNPATGFLGSSNLTFPGLSKQGELNVDVLDQDACQKLQKWFDDRWNDQWCLDISNELIEILDTSWAREELLPPYHIYLKMAYHLSQEARAGLSEFHVPRDFGNKLLAFQTAAVKIAAQYLNKRGGVVIGDVVGLGKTLMSVALARRLSPDSLSVMEFKSEADVEIAEKFLRFPLLGADINGAWKLELHREFNMTDDAYLFKRQPGKYRLPLFEGKMIWQFANDLAEPRFWIEESEGRKALLGETKDTGQTLGYQKCRLAYRSVASNTNERSLICSVIPPSFTGNSLNISDSLDVATQFFCVGVLNSFAIDWFLRLKVTTNINMFYIYQLPLPRLTNNNPEFKAIVNRVARLICTTPQFDRIAKEVGMSSFKEGAVNNTERALIRAELDGLIAHLYGLSESEFGHILQAFPIVKQSEKDAAITAYRKFAPKSADQQVRALIAEGENANLEFKSSARWDVRQNTVSKVMEQVVVKTAAGFLNVEAGGTLLLGVDDDGKVIGLENDYKTLGKKQNRDAYENWLTTLLLGEFGKHASPLINVSFHEIDGKDVCQLVFKPSSHPVFVKDGNGEHLYIRTGNSTRLLTSREAIAYSKQRWP